MTAHGRFVCPHSGQNSIAYLVAKDSGQSTLAEPRRNVPFVLLRQPNLLLLDRPIHFYLNFN